MRTGLTSSVILHTVALAFGLFTLSSPPAMPASDVESVSVDIVPMEAIAQTLQGDKKAVMHDKPAPVPTKRPDIVPNAQKVGENTVDTEKPVTDEAKPKPIEKTAAPPPAPTPTEKPAVEDVPKPQEKPKPTPATEVAPTPTPKEEVKPEPVKQTEPKPTPAKQPAPTPPKDTTAAIPKEEVKPDAVAEAIDQQQPTEEAKLPDSAPAPEARPKPQPAQAESAKAPDRKDAEKPVKEASSKPKSDEKQFNADEITALLDKQKPSGGGAKRSTQQASLGGEKDQGQKLSKSEQGALEAQLGGCWTLPVGLEGSEDFTVVVRFNLNASGKLEGRPTVEKSSGNPQFDASAVRAVQKCDVAGLQVPAGKQDIWSDVRVNFDPRAMLGL
ncbi:TonB family protein [Mesorhizobium sp. M2D.F.Ca.ET.185.01.1.1]|uniref:TonB family protein n=1 Tax=unclassified Mesorhizobium TaxID=325217 RepID=UPI000FCB6238|nr:MULTISPECIES: TonB family protein [unclassified Mesorhizobium]TGP83465.1 TonB family protein [bacterium M00.F.Ca.ET.227.01.1.1]TGP99420.1 TonB family protein [bacterium M00.F.Ca.ET.221.01.1.1]TGQ00150.1 TonB family protein [bacterium M00.F.Ca.ET.222.01.1.1]TGU11536.1 TonB family protein [bacterium M00.F.Ca.ET.163.01.1.1]TGU35135.1 TonB family protein [bacterium M00.F.Ca.ET.156.01.1.1]TGU51481.1 TonB family protein [bacterium M00.F.Ca.ET.146.01.1.1]TGV71550.1 TonB family protein [Mesorhizo